MKSVFALLVVASLTACARGAPDLPPTFSQSNSQEIAEALGVSEAQKSYSCERIKKEQDLVLAEYQKHEATIKNHRVGNQVVGYFGAVLFLPILVAAENNEEEKASLDKLQNEKDQLNYLARIKNCSAA